MYSIFKEGGGMGGELQGGNMNRLEFKIMGIKTESKKNFKNKAKVTKPFGFNLPGWLLLASNNKKKTIRYYKLL